jgi:hypothetical protein
MTSLLSLYNMSQYVTKLQLEEQESTFTLVVPINQIVCEVSQISAVHWQVPVREGA